MEIDESQFVSTSNIPSNVVSALHMQTQDFAIDEDALMGDSDLAVNLTSERLDLPRDDMEDLANDGEDLNLLMGPPRRTRKKKAMTLRAEDWELYKERIVDLHITNNMPLPKVMQFMKENHSFAPRYVVAFNQRPRINANTRGSSAYDNIANASVIGDLTKTSSQEK